MWVSKAKYEALTRIVSDLERKVEALGAIHDMRTTKCLPYPHERFGYKYVCSHDATLQTKNFNITLEELARYVVDGTPITRTETKNVVVFPKEDVEE